MVTGVKKIRTQNFADEDLVAECQNETSCGDCDAITWITPEKGKRTKPPAGTVAIVVNVGNNKGAVRIYEDTSRKYIDGIGIEEAGNQVMVPWDSNWYYSAAGSLPVGYIVEKAK